MDERRTGWLLLALLAGHLVLLAYSLPEEEGRGTVLEQAGLRMVGPMARATTGTGELFTGFGERVKDRRRLREENQRLAEEVEALRLEVSRLRRVEREVGRLSAALGHVREAPGDLTIADIVYLDRSSWLRTVILHSEAAPMKRNQPILAADGLVGRVVNVAGPYARGQLLTDTAASVGAMVERTARQGVVRGRSGGELALDYIPLQSDLVVGDVVVTAGIDGVYPQGIPVGTVVEVEPGDELFYRVRLEPAVDFSRLTHVYLLEPTLPEGVSLDGEGPILEGEGPMLGGEGEAEEAPAAGGEGEGEGEGDDLAPG